MTDSGKDKLVRELSEMLQQRAVLDKRIESHNRAIRELNRSEIESSGKAGPYMKGRISTHALQILKERGATPRPDLIALLQKGGAGMFTKNALKEINKAIDRCLDIGTIRETPAGLILVHPAKPGKKPGLFGKKRSNE